MYAIVFLMPILVGRRFEIVSLCVVMPLQHELKLGRRLKMQVDASALVL